MKKHLVLGQQQRSLASIRLQALDWKRVALVLLKQHQLPNSSASFLAPAKGKNSGEHIKTDGSSSGNPLMMHRLYWDN